jgi:hypothetical protein
VLFRQVYVFRSEGWSGVEWYHGIHYGARRYGDGIGTRIGII